ncbi:type IV toxin-antitoxin system AbiEi family antitoxin [Pseudomonas segetis]|uniref:Transcriptional regulator with AbiEi antitoxin N-terminal domain n=1 Tax=Pseudomonas segetis TaxID=298908 RepID=A0A239FU44_9PSED|nr:type IV toxin-antitoxin system AbiEi family antitoxin [Pseudomonas segetis]SNS60656.1 transcriptional regulator with AbiEi antitoxin N-terminal domain [Pseudomonas segetis]
MLNTEARQRLQKVLPLDMVATKSWLEAQGLNLHFLDNAVRNRTLIPLVSGVYARQEARLSWKSIAASLQRMSEAPVHIGGLTALELEGLGHYLSKGNKPSVQLYCDVALPRWLGRIASPAQFEWHGTRRLWPETLMQDDKYLRQDNWQASCDPLHYSCPEKAILELLAGVPNSISFEHADQLMQGLHNLSPRKLDTLLRACCSIKAKRLFLWLAERHQHAWLKHLRPDQYALGNGKRLLAKGGKLEPTWQITVPKEM